VWFTPPGVQIAKSHRFNMKKPRLLHRGWHNDRRGAGGHGTDGRRLPYSWATKRSVSQPFAASILIEHNSQARFLSPPSCGVKPAADGQPPELLPRLQYPVDTVVVGPGRI
jgi:hypothetical protein